ncbi:PAS domain-containing protein [Desulfopila aestuarii]|uniref:PAS domain S-box-containing protein n=1 Tax=Desulfopila aestuarii DSM 18488 TaxID=1121416 RepID=A0A1M7YAY3_9BACT|nr:PAS domain-containing protein [Desulfopila aestuarii]SHO49785.1 PAS domain S-box-containing protein [Desulfopila aestuarii DSM 18488]
MKVDIRIVSLSMLVGVALIIFDFLMDSTFLKDMNNDQHQLIMGMVILGTFFAFGLVVSHQFYNFREAERRASQASVFLQQLINAIPAPVFYKDRNYIYTGCNKSFAEFLGRSATEIVGRTVYDLAPKHLADVYHVKDRELMENPGVQIYESKVKGGTPDESNVIFHKATYLDEAGDVDGMIGIILDITELRRTEVEREKLIVELQDALDKVKVLSGFLPICGTCKKIRNDSGYWQQIEAYIRQHSKAVFSHSICPDCAKKLFTDYEAEQKEQTAKTQQGGSRV